MTNGFAKSKGAKIALVWVVAIALVATTMMVTSGFRHKEAEAAGTEVNTTLSTDTSDNVSTNQSGQSTAETTVSTTTDQSTTGVYDYPENYEQPEPDENGVIQPVIPEPGTEPDNYRRPGPSTSTSGSGLIHVTLSIEAFTLDRGWIMEPRVVEVQAGETVFDVLYRECRASGIHMASRWTPLYDSAYIEGIDNLYEFDGGQLSGWMYEVNGWFPNYGASKYYLQDGDVIEWRYTCDLGRDIGGEYAAYS